MGAAVVAVCVLLFECFFPLTLLLPPSLRAGVLVFGGVFHLSNAAILGLSTFTWTFVGLYPALWWSAEQTRAWLAWGP